jgi:hypothetical protein
MAQKMANSFRSAKDPKTAERAFEVMQKLEVRGESGSCSESWTSFRKGQK